MLDYDGLSALPPNVALMRLVSGAESPEAVEAALGDERLRAARELWQATPNAWNLLRGVMAAAETAGEGVGDWAAVYDRAVAISPEASVALYSFGRPELLDAATAEIVALMADLGVIGPARRAVEIGCGIGRFLAPLVAAGTAVVGVDVSAGMLAEAARRCPAGALAVRTAGQDLSCIADASVDLVYSIDAFPCLVAAGVAAAHVREAARVLCPGGTLLIMNWSYRGDPERDRAEAGALAAAHGLALAPEGKNTFRHWDGGVYRLVKSSES